VVLNFGITTYCRAVPRFCAQLHYPSTVFFYPKIPLFTCWVMEISREYSQTQGIFPMRLTDSITQHTKSMFKKKPRSHIFISRWARIIVPRTGMTDTFPQDMFWLVVTRSHASYMHAPARAVRKLCPSKPPYARYNASLKGERNHTLWNFATLNPCHSASNRNEEYFLGVKAAGA
jgi:hypothetical protein